MQDLRAKVSPRASPRASPGTNAKAAGRLGTGTAGSAAAQRDSFVKPQSLPRPEETASDDPMQFGTSIGGGDGSYVA